MSIKAAISILLTTTTLAGCASKADWGTTMGAAGGAVVGGQFGAGAGQLAAVALGTLLGGWLGHEAGSSLDRADAAYARPSGGYIGTGSMSSQSAAAQQALIAALNSDQVWTHVNWGDMASRSHGYAAAGVREQLADGRVGRQFTVFVEETVWGNTQNGSRTGYAVFDPYSRTWSGWFTN